MLFLIVTGLSGAGKSGAVNVLEDIGFYCIDNIPPQLIPKFADICLHSGQMKKVAIVTDIRGGEFLSDFGKNLDYLRNIHELETKVLFLDASDEKLISRYKETRRKHPLDEMAHGSLQDAINAERNILENIRSQADFYLDTTDFSMSQLKETVLEIFLEKPEDSMAIKVMSFGFKYGALREGDIIFDVRCLPNPYYIPELKFHTGQDAVVRDYVMKFEQSKELEKKLRELFDFLIPLYIAEGKTQLVIGFGCTGGKHRSVTFAERTYEYLTNKGLHTRISHRDINRGKQG